MRFAFDYDGTWSRDPDMFMSVAALMVSKGHDVVIITARSASDPIPIKDYPVYYTGRMRKQTWARNSGLIVDIWIDNNPVSIVPDIRNAAKTFPGRGFPPTPDISFQNRRKR